MLWVAGKSDTAQNAAPDFVKLFPNPAKQIVNLAFQAKTVGTVRFELFNDLSEKVIDAELSDGETMAQYSTANFTNGVYFWRLRDVDRTIKTGKLAIMK